MNYYNSMRETRKVLLKWLIAFICLGFLMETFRSYISTSDADYYAFIRIVIGILYTMVIFGWCRVDSFERRIYSNLPLRTFATMFPFLGLPIYLIKTRGFKKSFSPLFKAIGCYFLYYLVFAIAMVIVFFVKK